MEEKEESPFAKCFILPQRFILSLMGFFAIVCGYTTRVCLSVAITRMVVARNHTNTTGSAICQPDPDFAIVTEEQTYGLYDWSELMQGLILSSFYIGYIITHIPGGMLAEKFGGKWTLSLGLLVGLVFTALTPIAINVGGPYLLILVRIIIGLGQGTMYPAISVLIVQWVPKKERGTLGTLMLGGGQFGAIVSNSISGLILNSFDWPVVFYFFSGLNLLWFIIFSLICYSDPSSHPFLKKSERDYLTQEMGSIKQNRNTPPVPWGQIFKNYQVIALIVAQMGYDWGFYVMITDLPKYMSDVMRVSIKNNGLYSSLPFASMWVCSLLFGFIGDVLIRKEVYSVTTSRKIMGGICSYGPAVFLVAASYAGCNVFMVVIFFTVAMATMGAFYAGIKLSPMDLTPTYAGTLMGIVNGSGAFVGFAAPYTVGFMTPHANLSEWRVVFWLTFAIKVITGTVYCLWVTAEVQDFDESKAE